MARIFVSYRRQDDAYAAILKQHLEPKFGKGSLFIDTHSIPVGVDFRTHIDAAVAKSDAMLVVIGKSWLEPGKPPSRNCLFEQGDLVLAEIEAGLARGITVFPSSSAMRRCRRPMICRHPFTRSVPSTPLKSEPDAISSIIDTTRRRSPARSQIQVKHVETSRQNIHPAIGS